MNNPNLIAEINKMKISNEAMFQLIRKTQNDVAIMRKRVDSFIDETNECVSLEINPLFVYESSVKVIDCVMEKKVS